MPPNKRQCKDSGGDDPALKNAGRAENSIWAAARQRHQERKATSSTDAKDTKKSDASPATSASSTAAAWRDSWEEYLHPNILKGLEPIRHRQSSPSDVFVVTYHRWVTYTDEEVEVSGVCANAAAANEHVMVFVADDKDGLNLDEVTSGSRAYDDDGGPLCMTRIGVPSGRGPGAPGDDLEDYSDVDSAGCLTVHFHTGKSGTVDIWVEKKALGTQVPARAPRDSRSPGSAGYDAWE